MLDAPADNGLIAHRKALEAAGIALAIVTRVPAPLKSLADQVIRSESSIPANLAEGHGRSRRDRFNHWRIAYASAKRGRLPPASTRPGGHCAPALRRGPRHDLAIGEPDLLIAKPPVYGDRSDGNSEFRIPNFTGWVGGSSIQHRASVSAGTEAETGMETRRITPHREMFWYQRPLRRSDPGSPGSKHGHRLPPPCDLRT